MEQPVLSFKNIEKSFFGVKVLTDISFDVYPGEIVGLLGANGAGKSTLLKILGGVQPADSGNIVYEGAVFAVKTPEMAQKRGICSVYQELNLFLNMSVRENLSVGQEPKDRFGNIDWNAVNAHAARTLESFGLSIPLRTPVSELSTANQQMIEIARTAERSPKVLLLDEPSASLSEDQVVWLFEHVRRMAAAGTAIIYVSHRLDEIIELCGHCVILRGGELVAQLHDTFSKDEIVRHMIGRQVTVQKRQTEKSLGDTVFECVDFVVGGAKESISFKVSRGEILGIAGLVGSGRTELLRTLFGADRKLSGKMLLHNKEIEIKSPKEAISRGMMLVSEDRKLEGLFLNEPVQLNMSVSSLPKRTKAGFINKKDEYDQTIEASGWVSLDSARIKSPVKFLSGGNQQKVVIGKTLLVDADVILLDEPTRGVDVGARQDIYDIIDGFAKEGKAIILVSSDWDELLTFADRVIVMSERAMTGELTGEDITQEKIMHLCTIASHAEGETEGKLKTGWPVVLKKMISNNAFLMGLASLVLFIVGIIAFPAFRSTFNLRSLVWQAFMLIPLTLGQLTVIISGGIDLSMSATMAMVGVLGLTIMLGGPEMLIPGIIAMLGMGLLIGILNASLIVKGKLNSFIATLGVGIVLQGIALIITPRPLSPSPDVFRNIASRQFMALPIVLYIAIAIVTVFWILLKKRPIGRRFFAVGENPTAARWSGLHVNSTHYFAYIICSLMTVVAAMYMLGRSGGADPMADPRRMLDAIAYSLIGGATFSGGKGSIPGSLLAVSFMVILMNILTHAGMPVFSQDVLRGVLLLVIIVMYERGIMKKNPQAA